MHPHFYLLQIPEVGYFGRSGFMVKVKSKCCRYIEKPQVLLGKKLELRCFDQEKVLKPAHGCDSGLPPVENLLGKTVT